ncbi:MAG TPA: V-type ATPase 116kDa subunit family protein [Thermoanaerobaculia bacterium]|nr:V-type ATPase 116kDa subunit family protein [Thermoanaerobaculia bacterium]
MLAPVPMVHLRIQVPNRDAAAVTRRIASEGLLHLVDLAHGRVSGDTAPPGARELLASFRVLSQRIARLAEQLHVPLPEPSGGFEGAEAADLEREREILESVLVPLERSAEEILRGRAAARDRREKAREAAETSRRLSSADVDVERLRRLELTSVFLGASASEELASLAALLSPAPFAVVPLEPDGPSVLAAVAVPAADRRRVENALAVISFAPIRLPADPAEWNPERLARVEREAEAEEARRAAELESVREQSAAPLSDLARRAWIGVLLLQAQTLFAAAGRFVVISGWIPEESAERMRRAILEKTQGRAVVDVERPEDLPEVHSGALRVPILHRNPILLRPFQKLVQLYGTPSYGELQPTAFFAVSFLAMFGLMFGDVGHGLVLFSAGFLLFRQIPRYLDYGILLMEGGAVSTVFGFLYGSFFGIEGALPVLWMEPMRDLNRFMPVAIGFGVVLVSAGLVLGVINTWRAGEKSLALFGSRGLLGAFGYWVLAALAARVLLSEAGSIPLWLIATLIGVPILLLVFKRPIVKRLDRGRPSARRGPAEGPAWLGALEGSVELVDAMIGFFANTISFLRVAAFAIVHAGAFLALFALADTIEKVRGGGALSVLVLVLGNVVIVFLEGLVVSVQALRLEYYEFFGKFFRGGGEPYRPLMLRPGAAKGGIE